LSLHIIFRFETALSCADFLVLSVAKFLDSDLSMWGVRCIQTQNLSELNSHHAIAGGEFRRGGGL
jgi:hypothetical protein